MRLRWMTAVLCVSWLLGACSGGGGGGGGGGTSPLVVSVRLLDVPSGGGNADLEIWNISTGPVPAPPTGIPLNTIIEIECAGPVDSGSLPSSGVALGSINITTTNVPVSSPAFGTFTVSDAPNLSPGNRRLISFLPTPPLDPTDPVAGFAPNVEYTLLIPRAGTTPQVLIIGGTPVQNQVVTGFVSCDPAANPGGPAPCFSDPVAGAPFVVRTIPDSGDPSPPAIDPATVANNTVTVFVSEPLAAGSINLQNVRLINTSSGSQVPGSVLFFQLGTPEAGPETARIDYVASSPLVSGVTHELVISNQVRDFGGNPIALYDPAGTPPPSGQRFFATLPVAFCAQPPVDELFEDTVRRGAVTGPVVWDGSGALFGRFPTDFIGDGSFGPLTMPVGGSTLDTGQAPVAGFSEGNWNLTDLTVPPGANVRFIGPYRVHLRCLGSASVSGTLEGSAGQTAPPVVPLGSPNQGPESGRFNDGSGLANSIVAGGVGGVGGGNGGRASQEPYGTRTPAAESGFGPTVNGQSNSGPYGANDLFGGGEGGDGGCRYVPGIGGCGSPGDLGGIGGAGGSAWEPGGDGRALTTQAMGCMPVPSMLQPISVATPVPPAMIFPISVASAGSGGGGGGDRFESNFQGVPDPTLDDQGGGGGGGGGGIRISAVNNVNINQGAALRFNGAGGGVGNIFFGGGGGGGSGGEIWLESFSSVFINSMALLFVSPGPSGNSCGNQHSGAGGAGLYQFEDADGVINTNFTPSGGSTGGQNINVVQFPFSTTVTGMATSVFIDTGYGNPDYDPASVIEVVDFGANPAPGGMVVIEYQGAFEALTGGQPDLTNLSPWVTGTNLDQLDGYRYSRFRVTISYDSPNAQGTGTTVTDDLPAVQRVSYQYSIPCSF